MREGSSFSTSTQHAFLAICQVLPFCLLKTQRIPSNPLDRCSRLISSPVAKSQVRSQIRGPKLSRELSLLH